MQKDYFAESAHIKRLQIRQKTNLHVANAISNNHQHALQSLTGLLEIGPPPSE